MKLFDFLQNFEFVSEDTSDNYFDALIHIDYDESTKPSCEYDKFCLNIYKAVEFEKVNKYGVWIIKWSDFVRDRIEEFMELSDSYLSYVNSLDEDEDANIDDFVYEWINNIHLALAGYGTESYYKEFNDLFSKGWL